MPPAEFLCLSLHKNMTSQEELSLERRGIHDIHDVHQDPSVSPGGDEGEDQPDRDAGGSTETRRPSIGASCAEHSTPRPAVAMRGKYPDLRGELKELSKKGPRSSPSPRHNRREPPSEGKTASSSSQWLWYCGAALVCALVLLAQRLFWEQPVPVPPSDRRLITLRQHLRKLKETFSAQPEYNWQIIRSSVTDMINDTGIYTGPAVILFLASIKNENFATCLSQRVATALSYAFDDGGDYGTIAADDLLVSEDVAKHVIENRCREVVEKQQRHVMLASHLEKWNPDAAMMLHPLCDQENAWYKNVTYILTVFTRNEDVSGQKERREYDRLAENALNHAWESMDTNQRHAIISRVTGNVVLVREDSVTCALDNIRM